MAFLSALKGGSRYTARALLAGCALAAALAAAPSDGAVDHGADGSAGPLCTVGGSLELACRQPGATAGQAAAPAVESIAFEPELGIHAVTLPRGATGEHELLFPLGGAFSTAVDVKVMRIGDPGDRPGSSGTVVAPVIETIGGARDRGVAVHRANEWSGLAEIDPRTTTAIGVRLRLAEAAPADEPGLYRIEISSSLDESVRRSWTFAVNRTPGGVAAHRPRQTAPRQTGHRLLAPITAEP